MTTAMTTATTTGLPVDLPDAVIEQLGRELDEIYDATIASLGADDERYIRRLIRTQRTLALGSRVAMLAGAAIRPRGLLGRKVGPTGHRAGAALLAGGTAGLGLAKILENMEIGHNVMHGQWDWMNDPEINSTVWEWDTVCSSDHWKHGHNIVHHTWTNVLGKDRDIGYEIMRTTSEKPWNPVYLAQPIYNTLLALLFEWGVGLHEIDFDKLAGGTRDEKIEQLELFQGFARKAVRQAAKDYVLWPSLAGPGFRDVMAADAAANLIRNVWSYVIIFCGHFPDGVHLFDESVTEDETRAGWYLRQMLGSANIDGGAAFHVLAGNLSHQVEHHLFPDMPSNRYSQVAPRVEALCARYGLPYNKGPLRRQFGTTIRKIWRYALPGGEDKIATAPAVPGS
ncbi:MAG: fatty acid desaturase [Ilumatobacteraceae bacterium]|nr:fatty acid desaturase [Ilumatobacteraceae bacterium]